MIYEDTAEAAITKDRAAGHFPSVPGEPERGVTSTCRHVQSSTARGRYHSAQSLLHILRIGQNMRLAVTIALPVELRSRSRLLSVQGIFVFSFLSREITPLRLIQD